MELQMYKDDLNSKLAPYAQETAKKFNEDVQLLANKLRTHMEDAKDRVNEYTEELRTIMEQNADEVKNRVNTYAKKLKKRFNKDVQEINKWVMPLISITWPYLCSTFIKKWTLPFKSLDQIIIIKKTCITLIISDSKDIYNVKKEIYFK